MTAPLEFEEYQSKVIASVQALLGDLEESLEAPLPRGAVIGAMFAVAAAAARNPRFEGEREMPKRNFFKLAQRAYAVAARVDRGKN